MIITPQDVAKKLCPLLDSLASRWSHEKAYEDFRDYITKVEKSMPEGATFVKLSQNPFMVDFKIGDKRHALKVTRGSIKLLSWV